MLTTPLNALVAHTDCFRLVVAHKYPATRHFNTKLNVGANLIGNWLVGGICHLISSSPIAEAKAQQIEL